MRITHHMDVVYSPHYRPEPGQLDWSWAFVLYGEVPGFPGYAAGTDGSVWSRRRSPLVLPEHRWKLLKPWANEDGHLVYTLYLGGRPHRRFGHQVVLETFVGPCLAGMEGCHGNGDPADNRLDNLRWDTRQANSADCIRHGRRPRGASHGRSKVHDDDIPAIRLLVAGGASKASVGRRFGISAQQVDRIVSGKHWGHVG